jgi:hypothetical protein
MAAFAMSLHERPERKTARLLRPIILVIVVALHAALLLTAPHWQAHLRLRPEESLVFLPLLAHGQSAEEASPPPPSLPPKKPAPAHDTQLIVVPPPPAEPPPDVQKPATIDWNAEAALTAKQHAQSAAAPPPRALDKRLAGMYIDVGPGLDQGNAPEFAWDHPRTHRVEALEGGGGSLLWINDRCFIVMAGLIPFPMCGVGKIPARGDLFDHMRDPQAPEPNANNTAQ